MNRPNPIPYRPDPSAAATSHSKSIQRILGAKAWSELTGERADKIVARTWPDDIKAKAATTPTTTATASANSLLGLGVGSFLSGLAPQSAAVRLFNRATRVDFTGVYQFLVPFAATAPVPVFVGEGKPFPMGSGSVTGVVIGPVKKMMVGTAVTHELEFAGPENASVIMGRLLSEQSGKSLDAVVFDNVAADDDRPAGLLNGVTPIGATAGGGSAAMVTDLKNTVAAISDAGGNPDNIVFIAGSPAAVALRFMAGVQFFNYTVISCPQIADDTIIAVDPNGIATGYDGLPEVEISKVATAHFEDTTPLDITTGAVATTVKSAFQVDELFIKLRLKCAWGPLAPGVVQVINSISW